MVPSRWGGPRLDRCLQSLATQNQPVATVVVLDGAPRAEASRIRRIHTRTLVLEQPAPQGFGTAANAGLQLALSRRAEFVLLLNDDTELAPDCLQRLMSRAQRTPQVGAWAPLILSGEEREKVDSHGLELNLLGCGRDRSRGLALDQLRLSSERVIGATGAALLLRAQALRSAGLLDEGYGFYYEDLDLCLALQDADYEVETVPEARIYHQGSATLGRNTPRQAFYLGKNQVRLVLKTFPRSHLLYALPLAVTRLWWRSLGSLARGELAHAGAHLLALASVTAESPRLVRRRRPMRAATFAQVKRCLKW